MYDDLEVLTVGWSQPDSILATNSFWILQGKQSGKDPVMVSIDCWFNAIKKHQGLRVVAIGRVFAYLASAKPWVTVQHGAGAYLTGCEREQRKDKQMDTQTKGWGLVVCAEETPAPTLSHVEQWEKAITSR